MELHCSQTHLARIMNLYAFETPMELHCSQTNCQQAFELLRFETPMELHCSQTVCFVHFLSDSLRPLWNYTALKPLLQVRVSADV